MATFQVLHACLYFYGGWAMKGFSFALPMPLRTMESRRGAAAFGGPKARQTKARAGAKPRPLLCVRFAHPPPSLRISTKVPFSCRRKPGPMIYGAGRLSRKGAGTSNRFPKTFAREYGRARSTGAGRLSRQGAGTSSRFP